jgi:hypothetical protein
MGGGAAAAGPVGDGLCAVASDGAVCGGKDKGTCACGECECKAGWTGPACECAADTTCPASNGTVCSGRGQCVPDPQSVCGAQCQCDEGRYGPACECDKTCETTCNAENGLGRCVAAGPQCGTCECADGYTLESGCRCKAGATCPAVNGVVCNGQGTCECGECVCQGGWSGDDCGCSPFPCDEGCGEPRGTCKCGQCACAAGFQGPTCACPADAKCPVDLSINDQPCGGAGRGICIMDGSAGRCGECACYEGYAGPACNCTAQACPVGPNGKPCSGNGVRVHGAEAN